MVEELIVHQQGIWHKDSVDECFEKFTRQRDLKKWRVLPPIVWKSIWWARNSALFENTNLPPLIVARLAEAKIQEYKLVLIPKASR
jgi:hypothetical protein